MPGTYTDAPAASSAGASPPSGPTAPRDAPTRLQRPDEATPARRSAVGGKARHLSNILLSTECFG